MTDAPQSAADPRPNDEPYYIDSNCSACDTPLVLNDTHNGEKLEEDEIWHDEWICPECEDGIHLDWPKERREHLKNLKNQIDEMDWSELYEL